MIGDCPGPQGEAPPTIMAGALRAEYSFLKWTRRRGSFSRSLFSLVSKAPALGPSPMML